MPQRAWVRAYRIVFGLLALWAVGYQVTTQSQQPGFVPGNFFSFFTIQSNLMAATLFIFLAVRRTRPSTGLDLVRGAIVAYMILTSVVHALLLSGGFEGVFRPPDLSLNTLQHRLMPLIVVLDWFVQPPRRRIGFARATVWAVYPMLYLGYTLLRGSEVDWYPYHFLDPRREGGYPSVLVVSAAIMVGFLISTWVLVTLGQRLRIRL